MNRTSRVNRRERLRLMRPGEVLDMALAVYQSAGWQILRTTALPTVLCLACVAFILNYVLPSFGMTSDAENVKAQVGEAAWTLTIAMGVGGPLFLLGLAISSGIVISLVADFMLGRVPNTKSAVQAGMRSLKGLFALCMYELLIGWSGVLGATVLMMISAVLPQNGTNDALAALFTGIGVFGYAFGWITLPLVLLRHALAPAAVVLEGAKPFQAARRSIALMRGSHWQPSGYGTGWLLLATLGILLLLLLPGMALSLQALGLSSDVRLFSDIPFLSQAIAQALGLLPYFLAIWTLVPVWCAGVTILYFERRIRLEGYDIEALAQDAWMADRSSRFEL